MIQPINLSLDAKVVDIPGQVEGRDGLRVTASTKLILAHATFPNGESRELSVMPTEGIPSCVVQTYNHGALIIEQRWPYQFDDPIVVRLIGTLDKSGRVGIVAEVEIKI